MGREDGPGRTYEYSTFSTIRRTKDKGRTPSSPSRGGCTKCGVCPTTRPHNIRSAKPVGIEGVASGSGSHINRK
jgi:hypothetical protein